MSFLSPLLILTLLIFCSGKAKNQPLALFCAHLFALAPLVIKNESHCLGIIPCLDENPGLSAIKSAKSFLKVAPQAKILYVHPFESDRVLSLGEGIVGHRRLI